MKPRLLDLFSGGGGAARGYQQAGFYVVGVDINPQPRYAGDEFIQADAMTFPLEGFDAIHASPPCQSYSRQLKHRAHTKPRYIAELRQMLIHAGVPYVIENVRGAELNGAILCGSALGLEVWRHRVFETSWGMLVPPCNHSKAPLNPYNTASKRRDGITGTADPRFKAAMGVPWMTGNEASEAIPPAFTEYIGRFLLAEVNR